MRYSYNIFSSRRVTGKFSEILPRLVEFSRLFAALSRINSFPSLSFLYKNDFSIKSMGEKKGWNL